MASRLVVKASCSLSCRCNYSTGACTVQATAAAAVAFRGSGAVQTRSRLSSSKLCLEHSPSTSSTLTHLLCSSVASSLSSSACTQHLPSPEAIICNSFTVLSLPIRLRTQLSSQSNLISSASTRHVLSIRRYSKDAKDASSSSSSDSDDESDKKKKKKTVVADTKKKEAEKSSKSTAAPTAKQQQASSKDSSKTTSKGDSSPAKEDKPKKEPQSLERVAADDILLYLQRPRKIRFGLIKVTLTIVLGMYFGAFCAKFGANLLEEYEIFVRGDEDDD